MIRDILAILLFVFTVLGTGVLIVFLLQQAIVILSVLGVPGWITGFGSGFIAGANRKTILDGTIGFCATAWDRIHARVARR